MMRRRVAGRRGPWLSPATTLVAALALALVGLLGQAIRQPPPPGGFSLFPGPPALGGKPTPAPAPAATPAPLALSVPPQTIPARVGLQVGHWLSDELPEELADLRQQRGAVAGGYREVDINLEVARQVAALLAPYGVAVDILPATVPPGYRADAFVAIHCDYNNNGGMRGYKLARGRQSAIPARDDALIAALGDSYATLTGLPSDPHLTMAMTGYYAFNGRFIEHAIAPTTPSAIVELGFLTNPVDRALLVAEPERVAHGLADGILHFLVAAR